MHVRKNIQVKSHMIFLYGIKFDPLCIIRAIIIPVTSPKSDLHIQSAKICHCLKSNTQKLP